MLIQLIVFILDSSISSNLFSREDLYSLFFILERKRVTEINVYCTNHCFINILVQDPTNLQRKAQKHEAFNAELEANQSRIDSIHDKGKQLITNEHYASDIIQKRLDELDELWKHLLDETQKKGNKLRDAKQQQQFNRLVGITNIMPLTYRKTPTRSECFQKLCLDEISRSELAS